MNGRPDTIQNAGGVVPPLELRPEEEPGRSAPRLPWILLGFTAGLVVALIVANTIALLGSGTKSIEAEGAAPELAQARAEIASLEAKLRAAEAGAARAKSTRQLVTSLPAASSGNREEWLAFERVRRQVAEAALRKADDKIDWFKRKYYAIEGHVKHPDDVARPRTLDDTKTGERPEPTVRSMPLVKLAPADANKAAAFARIGVFPRKEDPGASTISYPGRRCDGFLALPAALRGVLAVQAADQALVVKHKGRNPVMTEMLRCTFGPDNGFMVSAKDAETAKDYAAPIRYLVLEAASLADRVVHEYQHRCGPTELQVPLTCDGSGSVSAGEASFAYPWPEALSLKFGHLNGGRPFPLFVRGGRFATRRIPDTSKAETETRFRPGHWTRVIALKGDVPDSVGHPIRLELCFELRTPSPLGVGGQGGALPVRVKLTGKGLADYFAGINAAGATGARAGLGGRLGELLKEQQALLSNHARYKDEEDSLEKKLSVLERQASAYGSAKSSVSKASSRLREIEVEIKSLRERLRATSSKTSTTRERLVREGRGLVQEKKRIEGQLSSLRRKVSDADRQLARLKEEEEGLRRALSETRDRAAKKAQELSSKRRECDVERKRLLELPAKIFKDLGSVEIVDPWGRTLWVIKPRIEQGKRLGKPSSSTGSEAGTE